MVLLQDTVLKVEFFTLLGCYAAWFDNWLSTFGTVCPSTVQASNRSKRQVVQGVRAMRDR